MKPHTWRRYCSYRPLPLTHRATLETLQSQAEQYKAWLFAQGRIVPDLQDIAEEEDFRRRAVKWQLERCAAANRYAAANPRSHARKRDLREAQAALVKAEEALDDAESIDLAARWAVLDRYIESQRLALVAPIEERASTVRQSESFSLGNRTATIRTVRCQSATSREVYGYWPRWHGDSFLRDETTNALVMPRQFRPDLEERWKKIKKPDAPTTYTVIVDGRYVDSYLSHGRAKARAVALLEQVA